MKSRVDTNHGGDVGKFADVRTDEFAASADVAVVVKNAVSHVNLFADFGVSAKVAVLDGRCDRQSGRLTQTNARLNVLCSDVLESLCVGCHASGSFKELGDLDARQREPRRGGVHLQPQRGELESGQL